MSKITSVIKSKTTRVVIIVISVLFVLNIPYFIIQNRMNTYYDIYAKDKNDLFNLLEENNHFIYAKCKDKIPDSAINIYVKYRKFHPTFFLHYKIDMDEFMKWCKDNKIIIKKDSSENIKVKVNKQNIFTHVTYKGYYRLNSLAKNKMKGLFELYYNPETQDCFITCN
jgi:hypothetical protein